MGNKMVYLFGAGSSYNAIPVVSGMSIRLDSFISYFIKNLHLLEKYNNNYQDLHSSAGELKIVPEIKNLLAELRHSYSIDTLARKATLSGNQRKLKLVKALIATYITWEQIVYKGGQARKVIGLSNQKYYRPALNYFSYAWKGTDEESKLLEEKEIQLKNFDYRYESLLSVLASERYKINPDVSFISWNYDNQLEISANRVFNIEGDEGTRNSITSSIFEDRFIKLNGSAGLSNFDWEPLSRFDTDRNSNLSAIADFLSDSTKEYPNRIQFAWENSSEFNRERALSILESAEILIIIGYSFPDYNRIIDKQLLNGFWRGNGKKLIIQDLPDSVSKIEQRIRSMVDINNIQIYTDVDLFYVPFS